MSMFSDPKKNVGEMLIGEGMKVADFGSGIGFYSFALAERVNEHGKVFAIDIMSDHLLKMKNEAARRNFNHIDFIHADLEAAKGSGLKDQFVDRVVIVNMLFQVDHPKRVIEEAKRILKRTGKVVLVEWSDSFNMIGPHPDRVINEKQAITMFKEYGFEVEKKFDAGSHHYGLLFKLAH